MSGSSGATADWHSAASSCTVQIMHIWTPSSVCNKGKVMPVLVHSWKAKAVMLWRAWFYMVVDADSPAELTHIAVAATAAAAGST